MSAVWCPDGGESPLVTALVCWCCWYCCWCWCCSSRPCAVWAWCNLYQGKQIESCEGPVLAELGLTQRYSLPGGASAGRQRDRGELLPLSLYHFSPVPSALTPTVCLVSVSTFRPCQGSQASQLSWRIMFSTPPTQGFSKFSMWSYQHAWKICYFLCNRIKWDFPYFSPSLQFVFLVMFKLNCCKKPHLKLFLFTT